MNKDKEYTALVVDDNLETLEEMFDYFSIIFSNVYSASSGSHALEKLKKFQPDIVFTDIQMPYSDGFSLISKIREINEKIPIVIISAYDDKEKLMHAIRINVVDYLIKPLTASKLKIAIKLSIKKIQSIDMNVDLGNGYLWSKDKLSLCKNDKIIPLTKSEAFLLECFANNINKPLNNLYLFNIIWGDNNKEYSAKSIRTLISKLKYKLNSAKLIRNIYGGDYVMVIENE